MQSLSFRITAQVAEAFLDCQAVQAGLAVKIQDAKESIRWALASQELMLNEARVVERVGLELLGVSETLRV